jgi:hypothetical protein
MTTDNFKILFIEGKNRKNKKNQSPLFCRITLNENRKQLSTGINIDQRLLGIFDDGDPHKVISIIEKINENTMIR